MTEGEPLAREETDKIARAADNILSILGLFSGSVKLITENLRQTGDPAQLIAEEMDYGLPFVRDNLKIAVNLGLSLGIIEAMRYDRGEESQIIEGFLKRAQEMARRMDKINEEGK